MLQTKISYHCLLSHIKEWYHAMDIFRAVSEDEVSAIVRKSPTKSCKADPIPTALLKEILPDIAPLLRAVVNKSLQTGIFLDDLKEALVKPRLKKINLDPIKRTTGSVCRVLH